MAATQSTQAKPVVTTVTTAQAALSTSAPTVLETSQASPLEIAQVESLAQRKAALEKEVAELEAVHEQARQAYQNQLRGQHAQLEAQEYAEEQARIRDQQNGEIDADELNDGVVLSQAPGEFANQVTFVSTPNSSVGFDGGRTIIFSGGRFTHNNPSLVKMLRRLSKSGSGIHELESAQQVAAEVATDPLVVARRETFTEAQQANQIAARSGLK